MIGGISLIAIVLIAIVAVMLVYWDVRDSHIEVNADTYCPKTGPTAITVVLIDATDVFNRVQRIDLMNQIERRVNEIPQFGALDIYAVGPVDNQLPEPLFHKCNPGRASEISAWTSNPDRVERNWREGFHEPLESVFDRTLSQPDAAISPIMESIQWVAVNALSTPKASGVDRRLIIVSDLLQNSEGLSLYRGVQDFETVAATPYYKRIRSPLDDAAVDLLVIRRDTKAGVQGNRLIQFWVDFLDAQGVRELKIIDIAG